MKKIIALCLCGLLALSLLAGCSQKDTTDNSSSSQPTSSSQPVEDSQPVDSTDDSATDSAADSESAADSPAADGINMQDVVGAIDAAAPVAMASELAPSIEGSDAFMTDLFGLKLEDIEDYYGKTTMVNVSSDVVLMVKAVPGKVEDVKAALEARRDAIAASFEMYLEDQYIKATNGRVVTKGDYVLLVIAGDTDRIVEGEVDAVYAELDEIIDQALA